LDAGIVKDLFSQLTKEVRLGNQPLKLGVGMTKDIGRIFALFDPPRMPP
jgi:hypothetical protein